MKRMAIISAGWVPVPAVDGGAGEVLTTYLIDGNEKKQKYQIDVYTISSKKLNNIKYKNANIIQIKVNKIDKIKIKIQNLFLKLFHSNYRFFAYNKKVIQKLKKQYNYDYILIENNMLTFIDVNEYLLKKNINSKMIYHMHNDIDGISKTQYMSKYIDKYAYKVLAVSKYIKNRFDSNVSNNKSVVLYNCVDFKKFNPKVQSNRNNYGLNNNDFIFMYSGRICDDKGIYELVLAFKELCKKYQNIKLLIAGSTWYNVKNKDSYFKKLEASTLEINDKVIFTGYIYPNEMAKIYSLANCVIIPSKSPESFGVVALEAMAMKKSIISTNSGGLIEPLQDSAMIINNDINLQKNLYLAMEKIYINKELRTKLSVLAYNRVKKEKAFNKDNYFNNFVSLIIK